MASKPSDKSHAATGHSAPRAPKLPLIPVASREWARKKFEHFSLSRYPAWSEEDGPPPGQFAQSPNGYELPIAMEVRRGRYLDSFEHPRPLTPNKPRRWDVPLRDRDHVFLKGHRIIVQVQSTWFPVIDRNPQTFVPNIAKARASDYVAATQKVYATRDMPSRIILSVVPNGQ